MIETTLDMQGGLLDGDGPKVIDDFIDEATKEIADEGEEIVRRFGESSFRRSTGRWSRSLTTVQRDNAALITTDIVYGPWLEGVGSRNASSRFKGYAMFRKATQQLERQADQIADRVLPKYLKRLD